MKALTVVGAALLRQGRCLATRRGPGMDAAGLWEFPGGKVQAGETPEQALARELWEELTVRVRVHEHLGDGTAEGAGRRIVLSVYRASLIAGEPRLSEHDRLCWCDAQQLRALHWAPADVPLVERVAALLGVGT